MEVKEKILNKILDELKSLKEENKKYHEFNEKLFLSISKLNPQTIDELNMHDQFYETKSEYVKVLKNIDKKDSNTITIKNKKEAIKFLETL